MAPTILRQIVDIGRQLLLRPYKTKIFKEIYHCIRGVSDGKRSRKCSIIVISSDTTFIRDVVDISNCILHIIDQIKF